MYIVQLSHVLVLTVGTVFLKQLREDASPSFPSLFLHHPYPITSLFPLSSIEVHPFIIPSKFSYGVWQCSATLVIHWLIFSVETTQPTFCHLENDTLDF